MSASVDTTNDRKSRKAQEADGTHADTNGATAPETVQTVTIEIASFQVNLPVKFQPGMTLTENQAKILDAAYQRQFTNNENALAKSRLEGKNKTAQPTAEELALKYADYEPNVGGTPRQSAMERIKSDAAWRFWTSHVKAHNDSVASGGTPVIAKAGNKPVTLVRNWTEKLADGTKVEHPDRDNFIAALINAPAYADRIQTHIDAILAERGDKKATAAPESVTIAAGDLL